MAGVYWGYNTIENVFRVHHSSLSKIDNKSKPHCIFSRNWRTNISNFFQFTENETFAKNASFIDVQCYQSLSINWLVDHLSETLHRFVIN